MGNDLQSYRAAIGLFCNISYSKGSFIFELNITYLIYKLIKHLKTIIKFSCKLTMCININFYEIYKIIVAILIIKSGDVETNPGPPDWTLISYNVCGLKQKLDQVVANLCPYDIIALTESHLTPRIDNSEILIPGYCEPFRRDRDQAWGGVAVYVSHRFVVKRRMDLENPLLEMVCVEIQDKPKTLIFCIYRPPNTPVGNWQIINDVIEKGIEANPTTNVIVIGDLNDDLLNMQNNHLKSIINNLGLTQLISEPTRPASQSLLDPIICNKPQLVVSSGTLPPVCSDHIPVYVTLRTQVPKQLTYTRKVWNYEQADWTTFHETLENSDWTIPSIDTDVDIICAKYMENISNAINQSVPCKIIKVRPRDKPWITNNIRHEMRVRDRYYKKYKAKQCETNLTRYRIQRNRVTSLVKSARNDYKIKIANKIKNTYICSKDWWKLGKSLLSDTNSAFSQIPPLLLPDGNYAHGNLEKANILNEYFTSITNINIANNLPQNVPLFTESIFNNITITDGDVLEILTNLDITKAIGPDGISPRCLKAGKNILTPHLANLFNLSLIQGKFPTTWKLAHIIPIFKKGEANLCSNYRPISLLSCVSKIMERAVFKHLYTYLKNFIVCEQSGFLPQHSTTTQLIEIYDDIVGALDNRQEIHMTFFDISKAFDRVWHDGLIFKLQHSFGIRGNLLLWITNYLTDRSQKVVMNGVTSNPMNIHAGVPQGSVLGPLLFLCFINDLSSDIINKMRLFADDTCLYVSDNNLLNCLPYTDHDLQQICDWASTWNVNFNATKTVSMLISRRKIPSSFDISFDNYNIEFYECHKHLGVVLNKLGTWTDHINFLISSSLKRLSILRGLKFILDRKSLEIMYSSFLRPCLEYASILWDNCTIEQSNKLENIQLEALRIITGLTRSAPAHKLYTETGFHTLSSRRKFQRLVMLFKIINGLTTSNLYNRLPELVRTRNPYDNRADALMFTPYLSRTDYHRDSYFPTTIRDWNMLPKHIRFSTTLLEFKSKLRLHLQTPSNIPRWNYLGHRKINIIICRLRNECSNLNAHLHKNYVRDNPTCSCGFPKEDTVHYFHYCPLFRVPRMKFYNSLRNLNLNLENNTNVIPFLYGLPQLTFNENEQLFQIVQEFITESRRFN